MKVSEELLNKWVEKALFNMATTGRAIMKLEWESRLSELETELHSELESEIFSQILPVDELAELEMRQKERMDLAIEMGIDLSKLEELNAAERRQYDKKEESES